ncbi:response regulator [Larsenimonas rhizosphaerae]|uniref:Transcriptional regulatory protein n=1 Tax=Larsenimonas rhizosphaerae TaxID=2944682 RepID=A0AA42CWJ7_9GAMM|nr:response regulator [Larsenimonas rhizosphaerae]MCX2522713.1 response regulator [Larsenimonas rhizosphaerae]
MPKSTDTRVLVVEDDPMVMKLNVEYLARIEHMQLVARCSDLTTARVVLDREPVDLVLLDVYLGARNGLELVRELQGQAVVPEIILITAASERDTIREARRLGVTDYLIKPFEFLRFRDAVLSARRQRDVLDQPGNDINQQLLDTLFRAPRSDMRRPSGLPKGLTLPSLVQVIDAILSVSEEHFSTEDIAGLTGMSRVSVRKYLKYLATREVLEETFAYGQIGRPSFTYMCLDNERLEQLRRSE